MQVGLLRALLSVLCVITKVWSLEFNYSNFDAENSKDFIFTNTSSIANSALQLTPSHGDLSHQSGRVLYNNTFKLSRVNGSATTSINTSFTFNISPQTRPGGEGFAFILTNNPDLPANSSGPWLGVANAQTINTSRNNIVAVEFDTRKSFAADLDDNHVGLDVDSVSSVAQLSFGSVGINISAGIDVGVSISFDATSGSFWLTAAMINGTSVISNYIQFVSMIDLSLYLAEDVWVGFSASTSNLSQLNQIKTWYFNSIDIETDGRRTKDKRWVSILVVLLGVLLAACAGTLYWKKKMMATRVLRYRRKVVKRDIEVLLEDCRKRPVKFQLNELRRATGDFDPGRQLGKGGFGTVYRGHLEEYGMEVAVKRVSARNSSRGEREFMAEVTTISQLSHRNLVKLLGWCSEGKELLLVYEFLPRGSLDKYLFSRETEGPVLEWATRYKIISGVASALDYLHHGSVKRVLHRDVKASNIMLDHDYNARLGDFGLARAIEHDGKSHHSTVAVAGTLGYMAPECYFTGRASPETDAYAFGVFAMEVACGRRPGSVYELHESEPSYIVDWVWQLHGRGRILDAADERLEGEFDAGEMEGVLRLALACCHPNHQKRPSMRRAMQVLNGGALAPNPETEKPAFRWPVMDTRREVELPLVGLLFAGGYQSLSTVSGR